MTHTHTPKTNRQLPFGGIILSLCTCGARKMSDNSPIPDGRLDSNGWYVAIPLDNSRRAYDLLQNEGYEPETRDSEDIIDGINSNIPNID